ncbi:MAG: hypothetical protein ACL7BU_10850 [Candidatus Phlomobacter fragariae]
MQIPIVTTATQEHESKVMKNGILLPSITGSQRLKIPILMVR